MLFAILVASFVASSIAPGFDAIPMLLIFEPLTSVFGAVNVDIGPMTVSLIVQPFTLIYIPICMDETASVIRHVLVPVAHVFGSVIPCDYATSLAFMIFGPLTFVDCTVLKFVRASGYQIISIFFLIQVELEIAKMLFDLMCVFIGEIRHFV